MKNKKNVILVLVFGILIILAVFGVSYSYFKSQVEGKSNIDKLVAGKVRLDLTDELSVSKTNIVPGDYIEKELSVANVGDVPTYYKVVWEDLVSTFINGEIVISLECKQYLDTENGVLEAGSCEGVKEQVVAEEDILGPIYIEPNITHKYKIRITFVETGEEQNYNKLKAFSGIVTISGINGNERREWYDYCDSNSQDIKCKIIADNEVYRDDVKSKNVSGNNGIDFSKASSESNGRGLYYTNIESNNEKGVRVYYYRGDVLNNHLLLAGYCFRIVRTNEDGSLRLRYNGTAVNGVCPEKGTAVSIGNSKYNTSSNDNAYVGYMNGEAGASSYETTHANTNSSTIKESVDNWYENITSSDKGKIASGIYCGDRSIAEEGIVGGINNGRSGFGKNTTIYSSLSRVAKEEELSGKESVIPVLKCKYNNDKYTLEVERGGEEGKGNNALIYPVGLMSADEMIYAGAVYNSGENNTDTYLYTGETYWTMSPSMYENGAYVMGLSNNGNIESYKVDDSYAVVPVVNLSPKATIKSGDGTSDNPYVVAIKYSVAVGTNTITYGTIEPSTMEVEQGMSALFMIEESYGYKYVDNSCKARYEDGQLIVENVNEDITCNVKFEPREYTLSYDSDGGSACESKTVIYNKAVGPLCVTSKYRKDFVGWYLSTDMSIKVTEDTITTGDMPLKAKWVSPTYTLVYNSMGGSACASKTVTLDEEYGALCTPVLKGYKFEGWYDSEEGGNRVLETDIYTKMENSTIYAHWTLMEFTLTYDNNGGNGCTSKIVTYGSKYGELCEPSRTGYTFAGWYTELSGGIEVTEDTVLTEASDQTIYAHWTANKYTLTYDNNEGSGCTSKEVTYGYAYGELCEPSRTGYTFTGWYTELNGGTQVSASTTTIGDATIYAHWIANKYTLTYNNNGGSGCTSKEITYDSAYGELCTPTRNSYSFLGWYTTKTGSDQITSDTIHKNESNITIYAHWQLLTTCSVIKTNLQCGTEDTSKPISYTGSCEFICDDTSTNDWRIKFKSSGTLNTTDVLNLDLFVVGGGGGGLSGIGGGGGGYTKYYPNLNVDANSYEIKIGSGGSAGSNGGISYFGSSTTYYANGGKAASSSAGAGGSGGGGIGCFYDTWNDGEICTRCGSTSFGDGGRFGNDGASGGSNSSCSGIKGGTGQGSSTCEFAQGTTASCKTGVTEYSRGGEGSSIVANSGNGGNEGAAGSSGIVIIRNARSITVNGEEIGTYNGGYEVIQEDENNWKVKFVSNGTLSLEKNINVDIFVVGGGGGGSSTDCSVGPGFYCQRGGGGGGGYTVTYSNKNISSGSYNIVIGNGGSVDSGGETSYFGSSSTYFAKGGNPGTSSSGGNGGSGGSSATCCGANNDVNYYTIWTSGGTYGSNGGSCSSTCAYYGGSSGGTGQGYTTCEFGQGTTSGCNSGVTAYSAGSASYVLNSGNGGGLLSSGSSGIVIIRNKR